MRCTECHADIRPVVALDIDGTLGNWLDHWFHFADGYFNTVFSRHWIGEQPLNEHMEITKEDYRQAKLVFRQGGYKRTMPMYRFADKLAAQLYKAGAEVWVTTTRPYLRLDNLDPDTREWLDRNGIIYDHLLYDEDKYETLEGLVGKDRIVAVLDDEFKCYSRAEMLGLHPILMMRRHNQYDREFDGGNFIEAHSLVDAGRIISNRVREWKEHHA